MFVPLILEEEHRHQLDNISEEDQKKMLSLCGSAILILSQNCSPIKKSDLNRLVMQGHRYYRAMNAITVAANIRLDKDFGMRLYELEDRSKYLLVNSRADYASYTKRSKTEEEQLTILYLILTDIFASPEEKVSETDMIDTLSVLGLDERDLKKHIDTLFKKMYITHVKDPMHQDAKFIAWGPRAEAEIDPDNFFMSFLKMTEDGNEGNWPDQKRRIEKLKSIAYR